MTWQDPPPEMSKLNALSSARIDRCGREVRTMMESFVVCDADRGGKPLSFERRGGHESTLQGGREAVLPSFNIGNTGGDTVE